MSDPYQVALQQLADFGLVVDTLDTSGKLTRVKTDSDRGVKKSGWYVAHEFNLSSGRMVITGRFGNWKADNEPHAFSFDASFTDEEKARFRAQQEAQRKAAIAEQKDRNKQAAERAAKIWPGLPQEGTSPYLARKQINHFNARFGKNNSIAIPIGKNGKLTGLQWIDADGSKRFLTGTEKQGAYCYIEGDATRVILCEGFATGASIRMATGNAVLVCFDAGNLVTVADWYIGKNPSKPVVIAADNDHGKAENKGLQVAHEILQRHPKATAVWPVFADDDPSTDFNDLHVTQSLDAVLSAFKSSAPPALPRNFQPPSASGAENAPAKPSAGDDRGWTMRIKRNKEGVILPISANIAHILQNDSRWVDTLAYCDFSYRIIKREARIDDMDTGEWEDADSARLAVWLSDQWGFEPSRAKITDGVIVSAQKRRFHPVREYLESLTWDGTERIDHWLEDVYESSQSADYLRAVGSKFLIGAVARVMRPGCKLDTVMILEGRQGLRKSTSIAQLFGDWFSDAPIPIGDKDAYQNIQGVWCSELAELDSFNKAESTSAKQFFSQVRDRYRPSYGQHAHDYPRQTIFVGTTNQSEYLKDYTGNRRYWPVKCNTAHLSIIQSNRDQLWAEALHRFRANESWWPDDATRSIFEAEQDDRMQIDPWEYRIEDYLTTQAAHKPYVTAADILIDAIEKDAAQITRADQNRVSPIMRKLGYINVRKRVQVGDKSIPRHVYVRDGGQNA